jgi:short-subunit dehydrogenase
MSKFDGKTALITGASKGLGRAMARALAEEGAQVALVSRDRPLLERVAAEIAAANGKAAVFVADVSREEDVARIE